MVSTVLRRILPRTLFARGMLIVVLPVVLMQMVTIYIFFERHLDNVNRHASQAFVSEISFLAYLVANPENRHDTLTYLFEKQTDIRATFYAGKAFPNPPPSPAYPVVLKKLQHRIDLPVYITRSGRKVQVGVALRDGLLVFETSDKRIENQTVDIFILWISGSGILLTIIALIFLRNQIRPIRELAEVAERFGKGQETSNFKPSGASEVRRAGRAFLVMRERLRRQIQTRTDMLAGISHDLRTPLTRMKLELALLKDKDLRHGLQQDVEQMQHMISDYLDFTHGTQEEETQQTSLTELAEELKMGYARTHHKLAINIPENLMLNVRDIAFKRLLANLMDNAFHHGKHCRLSARYVAPAYVEIYVEDDGPGIPADKREEVLRPFTRLDPARNLNTSGVGLGLSVAQDITQNHGGSLELGNSDMGGLKVTIRLPV